MELAGRSFDTPLILAPMAGVSDRVFRALCVQHGASYAPSEMTSARADLRGSRQTQRRHAACSGTALHVVQIAGAVPDDMAAAAREAVAAGAEDIDINMGCPAKRVCHQLAGSALLRDEVLVGRILQAVVEAVSVPVTLKTRTGWSRAARNALAVARIAEDAGIAAITLHGRTRECAYQGEAEYDTIAAVKAAARIPVIANGDITSAEKARAVLRHTKADGLMIGRAAQGNPWLFARIRHYLASGELPPAPNARDVLHTLREHVAGLHSFYGEMAGVRIARKHAGWYSRQLPQGEWLRQIFNTLESAEAQLAFLHRQLEQERQRDAA